MVKKKIYTGPQRKLREKAYYCFKDIRRRCRNPKHKSYRWYGGKGVELRIEWPDFRAWYLENFDPTMKCCTIDRIDSDGNYEFGNIQMIERAANSRKAQMDTRSYKKVCINGITYFSEIEAAKHFSVGQSAISHMVTRHNSTNLIVKKCEHRYKVVEAK